MDIELVAVTTPTATETVLALPASIADVCVGGTYFLELWVSDVGIINTGVTSAYVDLEWPGTLATAVSIDHGTLYATLPDGTIGIGQVDELGGSALTPTGIGIEPEWARVAVVEFTADTTGDITFMLQPSSTGVAALGRGLIPWGDVSLDDVTLTTNWCADALLSCTPLTQTAAPNVTVEIFVEGVTGLNAYQVEVDPVLTSGTGSLTLNTCFVDDQRSDFVFFGLGHFTSCDQNNLRIAALAANSQTVDVPGSWPAYLGTYVFDVSGDATIGSTFAIQILAEPASLLLDPISQTLPFSIADACTSEVLECEAPTAVAEGGRYLQVTLSPQYSLVPQAIRITSPDCPGLLKYVDDFGCLVTGAATFKTPAQWDTVNITGEDIVPAFSYEITALCEDVQTEAGTILASTWLWGDVNDDATVNVIDIQKVVQCAEGTFNGGTTIFNTDLIADCTNPECDVFDVLAVLDAFRSLSYPGPIPCGRGGSEPPVHNDSIEGGGRIDAVVALVPVAPNGASGRSLTVEAFVQDVADLRAYQMQLSISGGSQGDLFCEELFVDTGRLDYVFHDATSGSWPWVNPNLCRLSSSLTEGGVNVGVEPKYLGTYVLTPSDDGCGIFTASPDASSSFLVDHLGLPIQFITENIEPALWISGDVHCDCGLNGLDISAFVLAVTNPAEYANQYSDCDINLADTNGDGQIDHLDVDSFVALLTGRWNPGDLNCDGTLNALDVHPFIVAMTQGIAYTDQYPDCNISLADINGDGQIDSFDISAFAGLLIDASLLGDLNCDWKLDALDIHPFVRAVINAGEYGDQYPNCDVYLADINGDDAIDFLDIAAFVDLLIGA